MVSATGVPSVVGDAFGDASGDAAGEDVASVPVGEASAAVGDAAVSVVGVVPEAAVGSSSLSSFMQAVRSVPSSNRINSARVFINIP
jgi:hypothetical protein